ncbi:MAG TPA: hypothetical protein VMD30_01365, partial [Tepidisphaeraceae bacterium]|nr:hypothetical protein [Tepidisphaeraceae bacterium]
ENCTLGSDDDCIAIKAGRDPDSQRVHKPSENIVIMNCRFHGPWGMITIGSEQTEGVQHVYGYNLSSINDIPDILHWMGIRSALFFKTNAKRGGYIRDIHLDRINAKFNGPASGKSAGVIWGFLNYSGNGSETGTDYPIVQDIYLSHITDISAVRVVNLTGLPNDLIKNVQISDCTFTNVALGNVVKDVEGLVFENTTINGQEAK